MRNGGKGELQLRESNPRRWSVAPQFLVQPGPSVRPKHVRRAWRDAKHFRRLVPRQPDEETQLHQFGRLGVLLGQLIEDFVHFENLVARFGPKNDRLVEVDAFAIAASFDAFSPPRAVDEDAAHRLGGRREEMAAVLPNARLVAFQQPQVNLVNEGRGLKGVAWLLLGEALGGKIAQFGELR